MVKARKRFGQHFLEAAWVAKLVDALGATPEDAFVEIGPGRGAITAPLAARVSRLLGIEVDRDLAAALAERQIAGLTVLQADVLEVDLSAAIGDWLGAPLGPAYRVRVVGNLPYNISSPILFRLLDVDTRQQHGQATRCVQRLGISAIETDAALFQRRDDAIEESLRQSGQRLDRKFFGAQFDQQGFLFTHIHGTLVLFPSPCGRRCPKGG